MTLLWDADPAAKDRYDFAVGQVDRLDTQAAMVRALEDAPHEPLVLIGPDVDMESACQFSEFVRVERPEVGVLLLRRRLDVNVLAQAPRAGVREVVTADDLTGLADACPPQPRAHLACRRPRRGHRRGHETARIVTVFSAKGGVGKTTFATNLGAYLAVDRRRRCCSSTWTLPSVTSAISLQLLPAEPIIDLVAWPATSTSRPSSRSSPSTRQRPRHDQRPG